MCVVWTGSEEVAMLRPMRGKRWRAVVDGDEIEDPTQEGAFLYLFTSHRELSRLCHGTCTWWLHRSCDVAALLLAVCNADRRATTWTEEL